MSYKKNSNIYCFVPENRAPEHALEGESSCFLNFIVWMALAIECSIFAHLHLLSLI